MERRGRGATRQPDAIHRDVRGKPGSGKAGIPACRTRRNRTTGVPSRRSAEAVSLRLSEQNPLVPAPCAGVRVEHRTMVYAEPAAAGFSDHRGLPKAAPKAAQEDIRPLRALVPGDELMVS